ncbi:DUF1905 domain-containing protein [Hoeflea alexandrii]|uniref:DUF1905 domain-containing protein n=1 Tax=Hoeflea alexandrii TaxID=288436 RepID=UPI0022AFAFF9|nr:DUF1905 domain-containing protein [Hoeflea alexandrii]MCZ4287329.1 DUF1905 domain-containing protein [Hoeflea alexandrii]
MDPEESYAFEAELWLYSAAKASWHFVTVPEDISHRIRFLAGRTNGFGSIRVRACIGESRWSTSLFPDKATGCYFLPLKADVRRARAIAAGDRISVELTIG